MQENSSSSTSSLNRSGPRTRSVHRLELSQEQLTGAAELSVRLSAVALLPSLSPVESNSSSSSLNSVSQVSSSVISPISSSSSVPSSLSSVSAGMAEMNINPPPAPMPIYIPMSIPVYKAESGQNVEIFLQQYEGMSIQMRFSAEMKASCFINYIGGEEVIRFWESLSDDERLDYAEIKAAFLSHFKKVKPDPAESYTKLSNRKQKWDENNIKKCEKSDTYFSDIRSLVSKCDPKVRESQVLIAYSNLHPLFREYVDLKAPSLSTLTLSELEEFTSNAWKPPIMKVHVDVNIRPRITRNHRDCGLKLLGIITFL
jgi:hypothetical protein